ncbi:MAG: DegT/DnrJ/EryC1/StrS family aminotransferase [Pseudomonadota bacterium]
MQFVDLAAQQTRLRDRIDARIAAVLDHGAYIMGPEVAELEQKLAQFCGAGHCISCANGTDALQLVLMALGIRTGDAVFVPSFTFAATAEVIPCMGATPVFVDIDLATYTMSPESLQRAVDHAKTLGLRPAAIIPVDLFGLPADYPAIKAIADSEGMFLIADSAQGWGGEIDGQKTGTFGTVTTTSFFPAKPLGCYGDGGAIFTNDATLAATLDSLRVHGKGAEKYENVRIGMNSRLDTIQAAILLEKLSVYADEIDARNRVANRYSTALHNRYVTPHVPKGYRSIWAQYTLAAADERARDQIMQTLVSAGIPTAIYYPRPLHEQAAYSSFPSDPEGLPHSTRASQCVFSLPMHPYLETADQDFVIETLQQCS